MEGTAVPGRLTGRIAWRAARVASTRTETPTARTITFDVPGWPGHRAGQHVDLRLTAEDGYRAQRSYSIASAPGTARIEITVERLDDGEVSPYLTDVAREGDIIELRGPIGGYFVWDPETPRPIALIAGGSGIAPLMSMLRHRAAVSTMMRGSPPARLLYSARSVADMIYHPDLDAMSREDPSLHVAYTLTREQPPAWRGYRRRIDRAMLADELNALARPVCYVCGPTPMVETVATILLDLGHARDDILTERFGPTGGGGS